MAFIFTFPAEDLAMVQREHRVKPNIMLYLWPSTFAAPTLRQHCLMDYYSHLIDVLDYVLTLRCSAKVPTVYPPLGRA